MYPYTKTFVLKDLFLDFQDFQATRNKYIVEPVSSSEEQQQIVFNLIYNNFCNASIAYDTPDAFFRHFFIDYWDVCDMFLKKLDLVKVLRNLTVNELVTEYENITNMAHNDNSPVTNPLTEIIPYITTQSSSASRGNKALAIQRGITLFRENEVATFIEKFKKHFICIYGNKQIFYKKGC